MSFLNKLFGKRGGEAASAREIDSAVKALLDLYDDPEVRSDRGIAITGSRAEEVRAVGRHLHKAGGTQAMVAARDRFRDQHSWAAANLERIWGSMPEWQQ